MRPSTRPLLASAALLLATMTAACGGSLAPDLTADAPIVTATAEVALIGGSMEVAIANRSASTWRYNPCANAVVERREADAWVRVPDPLILCAPTQRTLPAGADQTVTVGIPAGNSAGTYRIRVTFRRSDGVEATAATGGFTAS